MASEMAPTNKGTSYVGDINSISSKSIIGWACDRNRPNVPITVKLTDEKGRSWSFIADRLRSDLRDKRIGNGLHGFEFVPPKELLDGNKHTLKFTFETSNQLLSRGKKEFGPFTITKEKPQASIKNEKSNLQVSKLPPDFAGDINFADSDFIRGWAVDKNNLDRLVQIQIEDNLGSKWIIAADKFRDDLKKNKIGNGFHGFEFAPPSELFRSGAKTITVKFEGTSKILQRGFIDWERICSLNNTNSVTSKDIANHEVIAKQKPQPRSQSMEDDYITSLIFREDITMIEKLQVLDSVNINQFSKSEVADLVSKFSETWETLTSQIEKKSREIFRLEAENANLKSVLSQLKASCEEESSAARIYEAGLIDTIEYLKSHHLKIKEKIAENGNKKSGENVDSRISKSTSVQSFESAKQS